MPAALPAVGSRWSAFLEGLRNRRNHRESPQDKPVASPSNGPPRRAGRQQPGRPGRYGSPYCVVASLRQRPGRHRSPYCVGPCLTHPPPLTHTCNVTPQFNPPGRFKFLYHDDEVSSTPLPTVGLLVSHRASVLLRYRVECSVKRSSSKANHAQNPQG